MPRTIELKPNDRFERCPKCGNNTIFVANSRQFCEDCCEVWVECKCGFDPIDDGGHLESVMGGTGDENIALALDCWNDAIRK